MARFLADEGVAAAQISRWMGVPRSTIRDWLGADEARLAETCESCGHPVHDFALMPEEEYAYLLGLYLGDGVISCISRTYRLRISMDARYPGIVSSCVRAMQVVAPANRVHVQRRSANEVEISSCSNAWPCLFPQHGPGPKHARRIELVPWQEAIVDRHPEAFLRGLIHSDGCRVLNRVNGKAYPRYFFTQVSLDIRELFCRSCGRLGIHYTFSRRGKDVSIARARSVALMDGFVGAKS